MLFNFDDLLEVELRRRQATVQPYATKGSSAGRPFKGALTDVSPELVPWSRQDIVSTAPGDHRLTESVFHWGLSEIVERLRNYTVLLIGLSMSDPASAPPGSEPQ